MNDPSFCEEVFFSRSRFVVVSERRKKSKKAKKKLKKGMLNLYLGAQHVVQLAEHVGERDGLL